MLPLLKTGVVRKRALAAFVRVSAIHSALLPGTEVGLIVLAVGPGRYSCEVTG